MFGNCVCTYIRAYVCMHVLLIHLCLEVCYHLSIYIFMSIWCVSFITSWFQLGFDICMPVNTYIGICNIYIDYTRIWCVYVFVYINLQVTPSNVSHWGGRSFFGRRCLVAGPRHGSRGCSCQHGKNHVNQPDVQVKPARKLISHLFNFEHFGCESIIFVLTYLADFD